MKRRILVVEDNAANLELLVDWLDEAFAAFQGEPPETVLLDVQLGAQDGLALATWIRREPNLRALPVIAVTAHAMLTDYERVMRAGCSACVSKPIDFRQLREQLGRWLGEPAKSQPGG
jgi:two-component system cell cycle response regulator DivK